MKEYAKKLRKKERAGFTLLELLIVIAVLAVLMTMAVITLNPAETLKKARDTQRITDLSTLKTAISLYVAETTSPAMAGDPPAYNTIYVSVPTETNEITGLPDDGAFDLYGQVDLAELSKTGGTGWIPIDFADMSIGSPISALPKDPTNSASDAPEDTDLCYRYVTDISNNFELAATFESTYYTDTIKLDSTDGGNIDGVYEVGTKFIVAATFAHR